MKEIPSRARRTAYHEAGNAVSSVMSANLLVGVAVLISNGAQAYYFGANRGIEVYFVAATFSTLILKMSQAGIWSEVLVPFMVDARESRDSAWQLLANVLNLLMIVSILLILVVAVVTGASIRLLVPGFSPKDQQEVLRLFLLLSPTIVLAVASAVMVAVLNAFKQFGRPEIVKALAQSAAVLVLIASAPRLHLRALVLAAWVNAGIYVAGCYCLLRRLGYRQRWTLDWREPVLRQILRALRPYLPYTLVSQVVQYAMLSILASLPAGSYAVFRYVQTIYDQLNAILLRGIPLVSFTWFSEAAAENNLGQLRRRLRSALQMLAFVTAPLTLALVLLATPLSTLLWRRGRFGPQETALAALLLSIAAMGFFFDGALLLFRRALLAVRRTGLVNAGNMLVQVLLLAVFYLLTRRFGVAGAAVANLAITVFSAAAFWTLLSWYYGGVSQVFYRAFWGKLTVSALAAALCAWSFRCTAMRFMITEDGAGMVWLPAATLLVLLAAYAGMAMLVRMGEFGQLIDVFAARLRIPWTRMAASQVES